MDSLDEAAESIGPDWVADAVFYQIFPDRFARSLTVAKPSNLQAWGSQPTIHGYMGGDLAGVAERLDYLSDLGITAIYFTPIFQSASNHRYHTHDYETVDPMLGGNVALRRLLDEAHDRGMKVVLDGVFNHASRGFFPFHDILENGSNAAYLDWFKVSEFPLYAYDAERAPNYAAWWGLPALPKFNIANPQVRAFLWRVARRWVDFGIDGWRLDVANEIDDDDFWREFRARVRAGNPQTYIVGEVWSEAERWLRGDMWDAVMNYLFTQACIGFFIGNSVNREELDKTTLRAARNLDARQFAAEIDRLLALYKPSVNFSMLNLLDSHDMARFLTLARGDKTALKLATIFQMTYVGAPSIYYGDEIGLAGGHDPGCRAAFPWDSADWDTDLLHEVQRLIALRKQSRALRRGAYLPLLAADDVHVHMRVEGNEHVVVALNRSWHTRRADIEVRGKLAEGEVLREEWTHQSVRVEGGALHGVELAPRGGRIFRSRDPARDDGSEADAP
jgi:neopullulanase